MERLEQAALACFLADGIAAVTVDNITGAAGMAKGNFYRYAADKAALVERLLAPVARDTGQALARCAAALAAARRDQLLPIYSELARELTTVAVRYLPRVRLYLQEVRGAPCPERRPLHELANQLERRTIELTRLAREAGLLRAVDDRVVALIVLGAIEALAHAQLTGRGVAAARVPAMLAELVDLVLGGVRVNYRHRRPRQRRRRATVARRPRFQSTATRRGPARP